MENEVRITREEPEAPEAEPLVEESAGKSRIEARKVRRYIRYVAFLVVIGLVYIWNSHVAEQQVRREDQLRKAVEVAKAEYKTTDARLSAGTRKPVVEQVADSLGLKVTTRNIYQLTREK